MENDQPKKPNKALIGIIVVVLLVAASAAVVMLSNKAATPSQEKTSTSSTNNTSSTESSGSTKPTNGNYADGTYTATGSYQTPGGSEKLTVKVTLADGTIESVEATGSPTTNEAEEYQGKFMSSYKSQVVGKNIDSVSLNRVAGSSLTSSGFNNAIDQIKSDAQA